MECRECVLGLVFTTALTMMYKQTQWQIPKKQQGSVLTTPVLVGEMSLNRIKEERAST